MDDGGVRPGLMRSPAPDESFHPRVVRRDLLAQTAQYVIERRNIQIAPDLAISRDVLVDHRQLLVVLPFDPSGNVILARRYHPANAVQFWGAPVAFRIQDDETPPTALVAGVLRDHIPGFHGVAWNRSLGAFDEDGITVEGRRVAIHAVGLDTATPHQTGCWHNALPAAIARFTRDLRTDSLTLAALLLADRTDLPVVSDLALDADPPAPLSVGLPFADEELFDGRWFRVFRRTIAADTDTGPSSVETVERADTVLVLPVQGARVVTLREYFAGLNSFPPGLVGGHAHRGISRHALLAVARREMREECGMSAAIEFLAATYGSPDLSRTVHHFVATDLFRDPLAGGTEDHNVRSRWDQLGDVLSEAMLASFMLSEVVTILLAKEKVGPSGSDPELR